MRNGKARHTKTKSAVVEAAGRGEPTMNDGRSAAVIVPVDDADNMDWQGKKRFVDFLLEYPGGIELERNQSPSRDVDL